MDSIHITTGGVGGSGLTSRRTLGLLTCPHPARSQVYNSKRAIAAM